jgi:hypothetical protein
VAFFTKEETSRRVSKHSIRMNTIQFQNEASGFTRRHLLGLDEPWDARLDFKNEQMRKQSTAIEPPCPFDEAHNGDCRPSSKAKLSSFTGCSHNFDAGHQSSYKTSRAESREEHHEEEKQDRDSPRQPYRVKFIQGSTSDSSSKSIQARSRAENSYRGSNLNNSQFETIDMPYDFSKMELFAKLHGSSIRGIPSRSELRRVTDFGETKESSSAEEDAKSESSDESEFVELEPRRKHHSKVADKRMPLRQRVDDLRRRLNCISSLVNEMEHTLECEGDMDYQTYKKARSAAVVKFAAETKMPATDLAGGSPVQESKSAEKKKEQFEAQLHKGASDEYLSQRSPTSIVSTTTSPKAGTFSIECLLGDQGVVLESTRHNEELSPSSNWSPNTPEELIRRESPLVSSAMQTPPLTTYTLERKMGSGPSSSSDKSPFGYLAFAFNDWEECWNALACTGLQEQEQSTEEACLAEQKKSAVGKDSSPPTPPAGTPPTSASSATATSETKQESNNCWTHAGGFPEDTASLADDSQHSSTRCLRFPSSHLNKVKDWVQPLQYILLKMACQKHIDHEYIPSGGESLDGTDPGDDTSLRGLSFCLEEE